MDCSTPGSSVIQSSTISQSLLKFMSIESVMLYLTVSSSAAHFFFGLQSFPALGSFPMSQFFASGGQSTGASASAIVLPMNIQGWFPFELAGLISLPSKGLWRVFSSTTVLKHQFFGIQPSLWSKFHPYMAAGKTIVWCEPLSAKWCFCFLICCLCLSWLFFQGASVF